MYCTTKRLKYTLFVFNTLCAILGIILIWFGAWLLNNVEEVKMDHSETLIATVTVVLGTVILFVALFGCLAAYMESKSMLVSYAIILVVLLVIQIILVSISYTAATGSLSEGLQQGFDELWDKDEHSNSTLSYYEEWLQCCGKNRAEDYYLLDKMLPSSCCKEHNCTNVYNVYVEGCETKFREYIQAKTSTFNTVSWLLIVIEFTGSVFACVLVDSIRNYRDRIRFYN